MVVVGAGFGGMAVARALDDAPVDLVVVDANNFHTFQPLLYQVATAGLDPDNVAYAVRGVFRRQRNVSFRMGRVVGVDLDERVLRLDRGAPLGYDHLVLAAGAVTASFGVPGVDEHAFGLKSLDDALALRSHVLARFEATAVDPSLVEGGALTIVVVGGGPTGVEVAGAFLELIQMVLAKDYSHLDVQQARVVLVEAADRLLGSFHPSLSAAARRALERRGVEVLLGRTVARVNGHAVCLTDGTVIPSHTVVWAAGVKASSLVTVPALPTTRGGRVVVGPDLSVPDHPELYVIGDMAAAVDPAGDLLPQLAPVAIQAGRHAARQIRRHLAGEATEPFVYRDRGSMATIGRHQAVAQLPGGLRFTGPVGWFAWLFLHLVMLLGVRNRLNVLLNWAWNYLTYDRGSRLLSEGADPRA